MGVQALLFPCYEASWLAMKSWIHPADLSSGNPLVAAETSAQHLISQRVQDRKMDLRPSDSWRPLLSATKNAPETFTKILPLERDF